jgi:hypothetical protein
VRRLFVVASAIALITCASSLTVRVEQTPEFTPTRGAHVSVFGVFHDGLLSDTAWTAISPKVSAALGHPECELGYGQQLRDAKPELASSIEHDVRENGVDDNLLARVAPNASGEFVMVLMSYRQIPAARDGGTHAAAAAPAQPMMGRGGMRGGSRMPSSSSAMAPQEEHVFELSASLYSVALHKLVAQIDLRYDGDDLDEAMNAFTVKLRLLLPEAKCVGWNWGGDVAGAMLKPE